MRRDEHPKAAAAPGLGLSPDALLLARQCLERAAADRDVLAALEGGGTVAALERAFAERAGAPYAVAVSSGTAALHAALLACDIGPGDEVITSPYGWGQTVAAVLAVGATPVFADIEADTGNLDPESVAAWCGPGTRAVLATHLFGCPAAMDRLAPVCHAHGLMLIADAAQVMGASLHGQPVGAWGDITCFSLGRGKAVSSGEGGLVVCHSPEIYEKLLLVSQHPLRCLREVEDPELRGSISEFGLSHRLSALTAALALGELNCLEERLRRRASAVRFVLEGLREVQCLSLPVAPMGVFHSYHSVVMRFRGDSDGAGREELVARLQAAGVPVRAGPIRVPIHLRFPFAQAGGWYPKALRPHERHPSWEPDSCPVAEARCKYEEILLESPTRWLAASEADLSRMVQAIRLAASA